LINNPQDVGQEREKQVDPQPIPAPILETGTSMQDIDGDDVERQVQVPIPEIPADWQPKPPTLSYITHELSTDVDTSSVGLILWRPSNPPVFDDNGLLVEENSKSRPSQHASQQGDLEEGSTQGDGKMPALVPIGEGNTGNDDRMPRLVRDPNRDPLNQNHMQHSLMIPMMRCRMWMYLVPTIPTVQKIRNHVPMLVLRALAQDLMTQAINQVLLS